MSKPAARRRPQPAPQQLFTRRAPLRPSSYNAETHEFEAVIATETPVLRSDGIDGSYYEILSVTLGAVRLGRLQSGRAPLLDSHRHDTLDAQIGVVCSVRFEGNRLVVKARLSPRDDVRPVIDDLANGIPRNLSIGYRVYAATESHASDKRLIVTVTDWEPCEVSFVTVPADPATHIRSTKGKIMPVGESTNTAAAERDIDMGHMASEAHLESDDRERSEVRNDGRRRAAEDEFDANPPRDILFRAGARRMNARQLAEAKHIADMAHVPNDLFRQLVDMGASLDQVRSFALNRLANEADRTRTGSLMIGGNDLRGDRGPAAAIEDALFCRMSGQAPTERAREWMGRSLLDIGAALARENGDRVSASNKDRLADYLLGRSIVGAHTTSDFPSLLTGAGNRVLLQRYKAAASPLKLLAKQRSAPDFRAISMLKISGAPQLEEVGESGEIKYGSRGEAKEAFKLKTFARIFSLSRNALINDDLGAFADSLSMWGQAAAETEANLLVEMFSAEGGDGAKLDDGLPLYGTGSSRKNKAATPSAIDTANLSIGRQALRGMKGLDSVTPISVTPKHIVVGPAKETEADMAVAAISPVQSTDANPFSGKLTVHVEPRFAGNAWRLFADPSEFATIVIAYLDGSVGPQLAVRDGWSALGAEFRAVLDFGCGLADFRGTYLNSGA